MPGTIDVTEAGIAYTVDPWHGQKTGAFLDQRENHIAAAQYAQGETWTASATGVDLRCSWHPAPRKSRAVEISETAVQLISENAKLNRISNVEVVVANAFDF